MDDLEQRVARLESAVADLTAKLSAVAEHRYTIPFVDPNKSVTIYQGDTERTLREFVDKITAKKYRPQ